MSDTASEQLPSIDLFWKATVTEEGLVVSRVENYFVRITNASLGPDAQKNTRTFLQIVQAGDDDNESPGIICTLKNGYETHPLDLLVTEKLVFLSQKIKTKQNKYNPFPFPSDDVQLTLKGENLSPIHLVGYLSPAEQYIGDDSLDIDDEDFADAEEADEEAIEEELKKLKASKIKNEFVINRQEKPGKKRNAPEATGEEEKSAPLPAKKQKIASGEAKPVAPKKDAKPAQKNQGQNNQRPK
ncbi:hypothetical protein RFI_05168 [Reticulomyxa filosa]|uniref:Nucleoplasmin-like domain-containing protein n=1 Tax=Reticulomyxa filosa TaxID=46433 RepID=X6P1L2_RETFI|nr:hypothetical protein RFI_05168 [Reticulomyxa filosa]|eukprot:ETO31949.1 hypothetical protein RFI_05168 [Reticulomyxa filosa]